MTPSAIVMAANVEARRLGVAVEGLIHDFSARGGQLQVGDRKGGDGLQVILTLGPVTARFSKMRDIEVWLRASGCR